MSSPGMFRTMGLKPWSPARLEAFQQLLPAIVGGPGIVFPPDRASGSWTGSASYTVTVWDSVAGRSVLRATGHRGVKVSIQYGRRGCGLRPELVPPPAFCLR